MLKKIATRAGVIAATTALAALSVAGAAEAKPGVGYIGYGKTNNTHAVWCVQHQYNYLVRVNGPSHPQIAEDGKFGPQTDEAIRFLQKYWWGDSGTDGIVGPATGGLFLTLGDPVYGTVAGEKGYCYDYIPSYT
ncbi:peptidoglycan-binding protein [Streptomyces sp. NBC_01343]|uniref:peptidoglycan-binding domain-containing protein n=1 Tax=Streptomyces sp. NBC_01343 TaxID=2903832 RepID=UPI002E14F884|nr:peptidoglycan-binding protein [Streptomyces sp. NBC_01343]